MMDEPEEVHYVATIEQSGEPDAPFAAVITLDGQGSGEKTLKDKGGGGDLFANFASSAGTKNRSGGQVKK
jgi:hypothetical protein